VRVWVKKGDVRLPSDPTKPVIMVGPGTGLALFKAFLEERSYLAKHGTMTPPDRDSPFNMPHSAALCVVCRAACAACVVGRSGRGREHVLLWVPA